MKRLKTTFIRRLGRALGGLGVLAALAVSAAPAVSGCSDGDEGDPAASQASCETYCDTYAAANCPDAPLNAPLYSDAASCKSFECADIPVQPPVCQTKLRAYYDCRQAQPNLCADDGCTMEFTALLTCT